MSNNLRTRNGMPFNFVNGLKVRGMDIESLIPGIEGIPEAGSKYQFAGNGTNKLFTLPVSPYNKDAVDVYVKQLYVHPDDYTLVGDTVTLVEAPPAVVAGETYNVVIKVSLTTLNGYVNANRVSFEGENLDDILEKSKPIANYPALRAYAGAATQVRITDPGITGFFYYDATDTTSTDNGGTVIVSTGGKRWKRHYSEAVNVKWFGAKGDGVTDDTVAIQSAINCITDTAFSTIWSGGIKNYSKGGGVVHLPPGRYRITSGLLLGQHIRLQGFSTRGYFYPNNPNTTGTILLADFTDPNQWVISSATYNAAGSRVGYRDVVSGSQLDNGIWNFTHGIEVRDLTIKAVSSCYGGIRLNGSPNSTLDNVGVFDVDVGYLINSSWGVSAQRVFSITYLYGFAALFDVNGLDLNGYFDGQSGKALNESNRLNGIISSDFGPNVGIPDFSNKKMGFVSYYANTLNMRNVIVQHWEVACIHVQTAGLSNNALYTEGNTDALFVTVTCSGVLNGAFQYNPALTGDAYFFGLNSNITLSGVPVLGYSGGGDNFSNVKIEQAKPDVYGWKFSDGITFLGARTGVVRVSVTGSAANIAYDSTYTTLNEALRRIENSPIKKWRIVIKDGDVVDVTEHRIVDGKSITFEREGSGSNPTIKFSVFGGYPLRLRLRGDCDVRFEHVNIAYTASTSPADGFDAAGLIIDQAASSAINLTFDYATIELQTGWHLLQQGYNSASTVQASFINSTISGAGPSSIMGGAYANEAQTNVICRQHATTTATSIKTNGTNGWYNANVISSNF